MKTPNNRSHTKNKHEGFCTDPACHRQKHREVEMDSQHAQDNMTAPLNTPLLMNYIKRQVELSSSSKLTLEMLYYAVKTAILEGNYQPSENDFIALTWC